MNLVVLVGNLTKDPELKTRGEKTSCSFSVACTRTFKNAEGNYEADFINCIAFGKTAEFVAKYFTKGRKISIQGEFRNNNYTKDNGEKVYGYNIHVNSVEFVDSKNSGTNNETSENKTEFVNIPEDAGEEEALPFS